VSWTAAAAELQPHLSLAPESLYFSTQARTLLMNKPRSASHQQPTQSVEYKQG